MTRTEPRGENGAITEETRVKLKIGTMWAVAIAIVTTTAWLTGLAVSMRAENQHDHAKLMEGLANLNVKSASWITRDQLTDVMVYVATELHASDTNLTAARQHMIEDGIRQRLTGRP